MKIGIIIQARKGSTRLPSKVVMPFYEGDSVLKIILDKIALFYPKKQIILATTTSVIDDEVVAVGEQVGVNVFRGSEDNVLKRFIDVIDQYELDGVIRVCADNPFLDVESFTDFLKWESISHADYISYGISTSHPTIKTHFGFWAEYVRASALQKASTLTNEKLYIEHVTNFIYGNPNLFQVEIHPLPNSWSEEKDIRFTLDTPEDFELLQSIYTQFKKEGKSMDVENLISYVKDHPEIASKMSREIARWEK